MQLVSDEIYHGITYGARAESALAVTPDAVVVSSFSKYFSMTGWRLGWIVAPSGSHGRRVERFQQNLYICAPTLSQLAAVVAFDCADELDGHVARYAENRRLLLDGLADAGLTDRASADGAFYVYADVSHLADDAGVAVPALAGRGRRGDDARHRLRPRTGPLATCASPTPAAATTSSRAAVA